MSEARAARDEIFTGLIRDHQASLRVFVRSQGVKKPGWVDDLAQDAFVIAYRELDSCDLKSKFPVKAKTPKAVAYQYYEPEIQAEAQPVENEVAKIASLD
ncbi:MAG: sigma factor [Verrucomicrobiota bacterium]|nr:sigma factor [Verrucomicrobiota bacterium]